MPRSSLLSLLAFFPLFLSAQEFVVDESLTVAPAITPGLVKHPVMAALDDAGNLFVAENAGVNLNKEDLLKERPGFITRLVDTDKDGVYDKSTVFADKLTFPQGALWVYDSLYVMSPPSLWRFADKDGDGVAEIQEELATGFDFTGNAADVHGPFLHPNGRLFWCHGRKGFAIPDNDTGMIMESGKSARIWSSQLSGGEVESFAGGGMDNPVEIDFTDEGEILGTVNLFYGRPRGDTLTHWVYGGAYPRFDQGLVLEEFRKTGELLPPVHNFGHVAVSGMCRYRSGMLNPEWADGWLVTHFNTAEVTLTKVSPKGASYEAGETTTILKALKPDTHFTDILEDHQGDLLVLDTGGWFRIGCPTSQIAKPDVAGNIFRVSRKDRGPYQPPVYPDWEKLTSEEVSGYLDAAEDWCRDRAITELAVRGAPALPELDRILTSETSTPTARINAVWTLARMKFSESADLIYLALTDKDAGVRQSAAHAVGVTRSWQIVAANQPAERAIELERNRTITGALAAIVRGDEPPVARAAATALGRMGELRAVGALSGRLGRTSGDRFLEHSLIYALIQIDQFEITKTGLESGNPELISGTLRALDGMTSSKLEVLSVIPFLEAESESLRETALEVAKRHPEWDAAIANYFFEWPDELNEVQRGILFSLIPRYPNVPPVLDYLTSLLTSGNPKREQLALELITRSPGVSFQEEWKPVFEASLSPANPDKASHALAVKALSIAPDGHFQSALETIANDPAQPSPLRLDAATALTREKEPVSASVFALFQEILLDSAETELRSRVIAMLTKSDLNAGQRDQLATALPRFNPIEWSSFPDLFRKIDSAEQAELVMNALLASSAPASLDSEVLRNRFNSFPETALRLEEKLKELEVERAGRGAKIDTLLAAVDAADPVAGGQVFASGKGACIACHHIGDLGGAVGPDLSTIGRIRGARDLYESILYPGESIARDFETFQVTVKSSENPVHVGLINSQSAAGLELIGLSGQRQTIPHEEVAAIKRIPLSIMPSGLDQTLSEEDLRNLVAYLLSRK
jgi:putative membrane-bound dehydrogenase-like protein